MGSPPWEPAHRSRHRVRIRLGVVGVGRGAALARSTGRPTGTELVALCDTREDRLRAAGQTLGAATYTSYESFLSFHFAEAVRTGSPPYLDVYRGVAMSVAGIPGYRSALDNSAPQRIPDFRDEADRAAFEDDRWSPDPADRGPGQPWPSVLGEIRPTAEGLARARALWREAGADG